ncbi:LmeA family phospholipid-binding protein [Georgenia yuyongxinii]
MRRLVGVLLTLVLVVVAAVVADRVALVLAEREVATRLTGYVDVAGEPEVSIAGFPFLTQVVSREVDDVRATAPSAAAGGVRLDDVEVRARGVSLTRPPTAREELTGTLPQAALQELLDARGLDLTVTTGPDGLRLGTELLGQNLQVLTTPVVTGTGLQLRTVSLTLGGARVDAASLAALLGDDLLTFDVALPELPLGLTLAAASPQDDGVRLALTGEQVVLAG